MFYRDENGKGFRKSVDNYTDENYHESPHPHMRRGCCGCRFGRVIMYILAILLVGLLGFMIYKYVTKGSIYRSQPSYTSRTYTPGAYSPPPLPPYYSPRRM